MIGAHAACDPLPKRPTNSLTSLDEPEKQKSRDTKTHKGDGLDEASGRQLRQYAAKPVSLREP
jgi:hypothetical protein